MVSDKLEALHLYRTLSEGLEGYAGMEPDAIAPSDGYIVDRKHTVLFIVDRGSAVFSTSWRETPDSREPLAAVTAGEGSFVLFLPGEPFIARTADASVRMYRVE